MEQGRARHADPASSHEAAALIDAGSVRDIVYNELKSCGVWVSVLQLEKILKPRGIDKWSISPRMIELERQGRVERREMPGLNTTGKVRNLNHWRVRSDGGGF